ncbi:MAG TPA: PepSY-like domain-containing protein [Bacteroidia bacterium]|jgi:hypothetical protein|nr:PepSY-like domain-containing protein [Bacteroidia bacterium]
MKKLALSVALCLGVFAGYSQKVKEADVPAAVKEAFKKQYPTAKVEAWEKEEAGYEAEFENGKTEGTATYDAAGKLVETEIEIKIAELPKGVSDYITKNVAGKKIDEASKITDAAGKVTFEAEVSKAEYIFDSNGTFVKKVEPKKNEKDDDEKKKGK